MRRSKAWLGKQVSAGARLRLVGQISVDTVVLLDNELAVGDQTCGEHFTTLGGTAAIVAHNAAVLGARSTTFTGHAGGATDDLAALQRLRDVGVTIGNTTDSSTGLRVTVLVHPSGERTMVSNRPDVGWSSLDPGFMRGEIAYFEGWHLFDARTRAAYVRLIESAASVGAIVALDVCSASRAASSDHSRLLRELPVDLLFANAAEAATFGLLDHKSHAAVVVHRGGDPTLILNGGQVTSVDLEPARPLDTTGAGDTFAAGFLVALADGADLLTAASAAHRAARAVLNVTGALLPFRPPFSDAA